MSQREINTQFDERLRALEEKQSASCLNYKFSQDENGMHFENLAPNDASNTIELPDDTFNQIFAAINYPLPQKDMTARNHTEQAVMMKIGSTTFVRAKKDEKWNVINIWSRWIEIVEK